MSDIQEQNTRGPEAPQRRRWIRALAFSASALVLLYVGFVFVISRFLDPQELATWLEPRLEDALSRGVELGAAEVGILPLRIQLRDLVVADPTGMAPSLASVETLDLQVAILPLLRREVLVRRLSLNGVEANLRSDSQGRTNFGDLSTEASQDTSGTGGAAPGAGPGDVRPDQGVRGEGGGGSAQGPRPFRLNLKAIGLTDARLAFSRASDSLLAEVQSVRVRGSVQEDANGWQVRGSSSGDLTLRRGGARALMDQTPVTATFDLVMPSDLQDLEVRTGRLTMGDLELDLSGSVEGVGGPVRTLALTLSGDGIPVGDLLSLLPDSLRRRVPVDARGVLAADLKVQGSVGSGHVPSVSGGVRLREGTLFLRGTGLADGLTADFTLDPGRSIQTLAEANVLGGPASISGTVSLGAGGGLDLTVRSEMELDRLASVVDLPAGVTSSGRLDANVRVVGPLGGVEDLRMNGNVATSRLRVTHPALGVPVSVTEPSSIHLEGIGASFQDLPLELGEDRVSVSGSVSDLFAFLRPQATPRVDGVVRGRRLDLTRLSANPLPDSSLTYGRIAFAKVGGRTVKGLSAQDAARELRLSRPESLPLAGNLVVEVDTVIDRKGRMEDVKATVDFGPDFLRVTDATFLRYGGEIRTTADLSLGSDSTAPFSMSLQVRDLDAANFLSQTTPLGRWVKGRISVSLDVVGTLDGLLLPNGSGLVGSGSFALSGGGLSSNSLTQALATYLEIEALRNPTVRDWGTSFLLENGRVTLAEATLDGAPGTPRVGGSVGLDGGLDLRSVFALPSERLNTAALERLGIVGEMAANVARRPEVVQAVLRIGGSVLDPNLQADPAAMARTLGQAAREEVEAEVRERVDAQKAEAERLLRAQQAEAQRRIDQQKQQLQDRATGFLRNLTQRRDTVPPPPPPDTTRPVMVGPDTLRPDTTRPDTVRPDTIRPDTTRPDTVRSDTVRPDTTRPDTTRPDTTRPDTARPDTVRPDTTWLGRVGSGVVRRARTLPMGPPEPHTTRSGPVRGARLARALTGQPGVPAAPSNSASKARTLARMVLMAFR